MTGILWDGETMHERTVERLSWACGPVVREGWHHSDIEWYPGMVTLGQAGGWKDHVGSIQSGLPWPDDTFDYVVSHHGLMMLPEDALVPALVELRRVTKPGGWLRVSVPDIEQACRSFLHGARHWFPVEAANIDEAFCRYVTQNGATRSVFTWRRLRRLLDLSGWHLVGADVVLDLSGWHLVGADVYPEETRSPWPEITDLDSRPDESIFMEAVNPE